MDSIGTGGFLREKGWNNRAYCIFVSGWEKKSLYSMNRRIHEIPWRVFDWGLYIQSHFWEIIVERIWSFKRAGN